MKTSSWASDIDNLRDEPVKTKIPAGFKTSQEWSKAWDCSHSHAMAVIVRRVRDRLMERQIFKVHNGIRIWPTPYYKINARKTAKN